MEILTKTINDDGLRSFYSGAQWPFSNDSSSSAISWNKRQHPWKYKSVHCSSLTKSYITGIVSSFWKNANVQHIPKKGDAFKPNNYRPISFVSVISKVMLIVINKQLLSYLEHNSLLNNHQFSFNSERSTADLLCLVTTKCIGLLTDKEKLT